MRNKTFLKTAMLIISFLLLLQSCSINQTDTESESKDLSSDLIISSSDSTDNSSKIENKLPEGHNMYDFIEQKEADSGEKGTLYYIYLNDLLAPMGINSVLKYDFMRFVACLQGLLNRDNPQIFVEHIPEDIFWYNYLRKEDKLFFGYKKTDIKTIDEFFDTFKNEIIEYGLVLWDQNVNSSANVATTVSGIEGYLPVRNTKTEGSLYELITKYIENIEIKMDMTDMFKGYGTIPGTNRPSSGSTKNDAYIWAMEKYIDKVSDSIMAQTTDAMFWNSTGVAYPDLLNTGMMNLDYFVANKAFVFDLSPWGDEAPNDDPDQPIGTDLATLKELLQGIYDRSNGQKMISITGFLPWHVKYTKYKNLGKHEEVESEWRKVQLYSAYNAFIDADAISFLSLANASAYRLHEIKGKLENNRPDDTFEYNPKKKYILFYMGDYDGGSWTTRFVPQLWSDPKRGVNPLAWPFNQNLADRIPMVFEYAYEYKTVNDFFVTGDSGAGYLNPTYLVPPRINSDNPSGMDVWIRHNQKYLEKMDIDITGFLLNSAQALNDEVLEAYSIMTPAGVITHNYAFNGMLYNGTPFYAFSSDMAGAQNQDPVGVANQILSHTKQRRSGPKLYAFRSVLCSPTYIDQVVSILKHNDPDIEVVDPYTFFEIAKQAVK